MSEYLQPGGFEKCLALSSDDYKMIGNEMDELSRAAYRGGPDGLLARWDYYQMAEQPIDFHNLAIEQSGVLSTDRVLDVGCGTGDLLLKLRNDFAHTGALVGLDLNTEMFSQTARQEHDNDRRSLSFLSASAERIPLVTNSIDVTYSMFMLYHVQNAAYALFEMARVTRPGGTIVIATSGENNKLRHRGFETAIADYLDVLPPRPFSAQFDSDVADVTLPLFFEVERVELQSCDAIVTDKTLPDYLASLTTMRSDYSPEISDSRWLKALDAVVVPQIMAEIETNGSFRDTIDRHLYICRNKQPYNV